MSAIAGILRFDGRPVDRRDVERMGNALSAHGLDRSGLYTSGGLGLTHLLMRMTPEDVFDHQPVHAAGGTIMAADIRLDNRDELAAALALDRNRADTMADSAIALAAWERWGNEAWARLRGPFAIAVWQPRDRILTLARDPMGVNLVTWHRGQGFFAFATLPKGLFALADVPRQINEEKFADFLVLNHADHETTIYRELFRLPPAHVLAIDSTGQMNKRRYWSAHDIEPIRLESDQAYAEAMREHLDRAVRRQLRSAHPVGCFLSGGLDSSSVAALAARALAEKGKRLPAYTEVPRKGFDGPTPRGWYADETPYVEAIRQALETIDVSYVENGSCDDFAELEAIFHATDLPVRNPTNAGWLAQIARQARANGQRVLLCGECGNATISWNGWPQAIDHLLSGRLLTAGRQWLQYYGQSSRSLRGAFWALFIGPLVPDWLAARADRRAHPHRIAPWQDHAAIRPDYARAMGVDERARQVGHDFLYRQRRGRLGRIAMLHLADYRGEHHAGMLAAHGVDLRDPTSDLDVVSFCLGVPDEQYLAEGVSRSLIRRAMWGILPPEVLTKRKRGMQSADWFEKLERRLPEMDDEITQLSRSPLARKMIDIDRLRRAARSWPTGDWSREDVLDEYQLALPRGLASGRFLRWFEQSN